MFGWRPDLPDDRDYLWTPSPDDILRLPAKVDLSQFMPAILDQGRTNSCTAQAVTEALRFVILKSGNPDRNLSRLQLYYDSRDIKGNADKDAGAELRDVIKCARAIGVANEILWPFNPINLTTKPPDTVYAEAHKFEAITYQRLEVNATHIKAALSTRYPVIIGLRLYSAFQSAEVAKTGMVPAPGWFKGRASGHAMLAYGYGDRPGYFTVRNSWGPQWGHKGDCYIPEEYIGNPRYGADYWRITRTS